MPRETVLFACIENAGRSLYQPLDPIATLKIEELIDQLKQRYTIAIVTHNLQQAGRVSQYTGFFLSGNLIEFAPTTQIFSRPQDKRTEDFITGRFG